MQPPKVSVVIPVYNEEVNLPELYRRLKAVFEDILKVSYEIIFVDDGSKDGSWRLIEQLNNENPSCRGIRFSKNFGHHIAITAGVDYAQGDAVVMMDADLQDPPEEIPKLYQKYLEGFDIVYAIRAVRKDSVMKKLCSRIFHFFFRALTKVDINPDSGIFRIMSKRAADTLRLCRERSRLIVGLVNWTGFSRVGVPTERHARNAGVTKYSFCKSLRLAADGITSFSYFPLRFAVYLGVVVALLSLLLGIYMAIKKIFFGIPVPGYTSIIVTILFMGSIQLLVTGLVGEYIGHIYNEVQNRPLYVVEGSIGLNSSEVKHGIVS